MKTLVLAITALIFAIKPSLAQMHTTNERLIQFAAAVSNAALCDSLLLVFSIEKGHLPLAYSGALTALKAKHAKNPFKKLSYFKQGKAKIEAAVLANPSDVEVRFLRYCLQKKSPSLLGYNQQIEEDERFIRKNLSASTVMEKQFKNMQ